MPLNVPKNYAFTPKPVGPVILRTRSSTRARLTAGGTYFRSKEYGVQANLIRALIVEDQTLTVPEGIFVEQHGVFKPEEMVAAVSMSVPTHKLMDLSLNWNEEIWFEKTSQGVRAKKYGIRWQIAGTTSGNEKVELADYGLVVLTRPFIVPGVLAVTLNLSLADWPSGAVFKLKPRTHRLTLVPLTITDPDTSMTTQGWDPSALRTAVNAQPGFWVRMPNRAPPLEPGDPGPAPSNEDAQDDGSDAQFLTTFDENLRGGDGLPQYPVGFNTGPDRVLIHLNYAEKADGSMGELNQVFEWQGESALLGSWVRYA